MQKKWERLIRLARETGDRLVVTDSESEDVFVLMSIEQYEELLGRQKTNNRDDVRSVEETQPVTETPAQSALSEEYEEVVSIRQEEEPPEEIWDVLQGGQDEQEEIETWDVSRLSENEKAFLKEQYEKFQQGKSNDPRDVADPTRQVAQSESEDASSPEPVVHTDDEDDFTEEQFYLEPIE